VFYRTRDSPKQQWQSRAYVFCTSLKSDLYFRCRRPPSTKSMLTNFISVGIFVTIRRKMRQSQSKNCQNGNLHTSKILILFPVSMTTEHKVSSLISTLFGFLRRSIEKRGNRYGKLPKSAFAYLYNRISTSGMSHKQKASIRPDFRAACKVWWKSVKNCGRNCSTTDLLTDTHTHTHTHTTPWWFTNPETFHRAVNSISTAYSSTRII